jgi:hypothetical protein
VPGKERQLTKQREQCRKGETVRKRRKDIATERRK